MKTDTVYKKAFNRAVEILQGRSLARRCRPKTSWANALASAARRSEKCCASWVPGASSSKAPPARENQDARSARTTTTTRTPKPRRGPSRSKSSSWNGCSATNAARNGISASSTSPAVRRRDHRHPRVPVPLLALRPDRRRPNSGWHFNGFTPKLSRWSCSKSAMMFELRSARRFAAMPTVRRTGTSWKTCGAGAPRLLDEIDTSYHDFSSLTAAFTAWSTGRAQPLHRHFYDIITFIFHYHYQWNKRDELRTQPRRDRRTHRLHRGAAQPQPPPRRNRLPPPPRLGPPDADQVAHQGERRQVTCGAWPEKHRGTVSFFSRKNAPVEGARKGAR